MTVDDCAVVRDGFPRPFPNTPTNVVDQLRMAGKTVVVNGAADGIGYSVAEAMAEAGGNVALLYNSYVRASPVNIEPVSIGPQSLTHLRKFPGTTWH